MPFASTLIARVVLLKNNTRRSIAHMPCIFQDEKKQKGTAQNSVADLADAALESCDVAVKVR